MAARGTSNSAARGSAPDRRARKNWMLSREGGFGGNGTTVPCYRAKTHCGNFRLTFETMQVDRIIPGILGGTYRRDNIRPSCSFCNHATGTKLREQIRRGLVTPLRSPKERHDRLPDSRPDQCSGGGGSGDTYGAALG